MAIDNYLNGGAVGRNTGKGAIGSNTGKGFVDSNINKNNNDSSNNVGDIYMHPPYAVIVEPRNEGGNVTQGNKNYQETLNAYNAAKSKLINATDEAATLRNSWSAPPRVALENGKLNLYGTDDFLKSNEAKQLLEVFKTMEGSTYNTEKLNQQIEAWNSTLQKMSEDYNDAVDQMNQVNNAILTTAKNPNPHLLTFSEMQKIGNSAAIGKQPDARTSKSKIFVGYEWDDDGNMKEKWVEAKEVFKEFDKISSDKKRSAYHALMTQANNGDVAAYSKLLYLQGGSEGGPANVDYDKTVGDFFNTLGNNILMNLGGFAQGVFDYARFFNVGQIAANLSDYAEYFDQRDFWDLAAAVLTPGLYADQYDSRGEISRTIKNAVEDYSAAVSWENAFFSELTPGSTGAASTIGGVTGAALGMAFHLYSSGVGQKVMAGDKYSQGIITNAVNKANEALISTGKFVPYEIRLGRVKIKTDTIGTPLADGGGIIGRTTNAQKVYEAMASSGVYAVPTIIAKNFPNIAEAMGYAALVKNGGIGAVLSGSGRGTSLLETTVSGGVSGGYFSDTSHTFATTFGNIIENGKTYNALLDYIGTPNTGALGAVTEKAMWNMVAKGFRTAQTLIPLTGFAAARNADEYLKRVKAGEDLGDMTEYIISNTAKDVAFGGALIGAGAVVGKIRAMAKAGRVSPADAASSTFAIDFGTQGGFYQPESPYYQKRLAPGNLNADEMASLQRTMSEIMTVNNEVFTGAPTNNGAITSALPGTYVEGAARTFGAMSPRKAFKYSVEETFDGAYLVTETTDLDTNTKVTTREFRNSVAEAEKEISEKSIPSTSPKTLANNDQVNNIKVAPLTVDGKAPATMPEGVSQVKFEPGTVYRTPDGLADEIADLVEKAGGSFEAVEAAYREAVEWASNNMEEPAPEAPFLPERLSSDFTLEDRELLRAAAWAKAHGYNAVPLRVPSSYSRTIKKFSMQDKFISKLADKYEFPEISPEDMLKGENSLEVNDELFRTNVVNAGALVYALDNGVTRSDFYLPVRSTNFSNLTPQLDNILTKEDNELLRAIGAAYAFAGKYYDLVYHGLDPHKVTGDVTAENVEALLENAGLHVLKTSGVDTFAMKPVHKLIEHCETKEQALEVLTYVMKEGFDLWARGQWLDNMYDGAGAYKPAKQVVEESDKAIEKYAKILIDRLYTKLKASDVKSVSSDIKDKLEAVVRPALDKYVDTAFENATGLSSAVRVPVSKVDDKLIYRPEASAEDAVIAHIPAGTKVVSYEPFGLAPKGTRKYGDVSGFIFDASDGVREKDGELYVNTYGGAEYTPTAREYTQSDYAIYGETGADGYEKLGKEMLTPMRGLQDQRDDVFTMVEPGGNINAMNRMLREYGYNNLPRDTIKTRTDYAREFLDEVFRSGGQKGKDGRTLYRVDTVWYPDSPRSIDSLISQVKQHIYRRYEDFKTQGSRINKLEKVWSLMNNANGDGWLSETNAILKARATGLSKEELKAGLDFFDEVRMGLEDIEDKYQDIYIKSPKDYDPEALRSDILDFLDSLDKKYSKRLPANKNKDLSDRMRLVDTWGKKGSHKVSLPDGVNYLWTFRGANETGNMVNNSWNNRNMAEHMSGWEVGGHYNTSSLDFHSMNSATPFHYSEGTGDNSGDEYIIATAHPNGTGVFYYGDPEKFGDRIHYADGGAIVTPYGEGFTVVSIRNLGKDAAGKDVRLIITIRDNADGTPYSGPIDGQGGGVEKISERVRVDDIVNTPINIVGMQYGVPYKYFADDSSALEWAKEEGGRAVHKLDDDADILDRPPMTTQDLQENPLLLEAGGNPQAHVEKFDELMETLPELMGEDGAGSIDYLRGVADITRSVNAIYTEVASNVNLDDIYERYAMSIYEDKDIELTSDEKAAIAPLSYVLDKLGHYFDPSGKSLTKEFYLPTAVDTSKKVSLEQALLGKDEAFDPDHPVDTGFNDILLDINRIGDAGFWKKRTGDLFRDEDGNFTMARSGSLEENITAYTVSALTRGRYSLATSVNNEVARSKYDRNRSQITAKQAYAGVKEADKIRGKTRAYHVAINKDADKLADLKNDYDEGTIDEAMKAKNYAKDLNFVQSTNHAAQLLGYNQFLEMNPIKGSTLRYGTQSKVYRGTTNIRRKLEKINITGPLWVRRNQAFERVGFGLNMSEANVKKYGTFRSGEKAVNLGEILKTNLDSAQLAKSYLDTLNNKISSWTEQSGDLIPTIYNDTQTKFPLLTDYKRSADKLIKQLVRNYHASSDPKVVYEMNVKAITQWYRNNSATEFNNAIMMTDISNLDERTLDALDEAAAYIYVGAPLKRSKFINGMLQAETVAKLGGNVSPMVGNLGTEIFTRLPGYIGWSDTVKAIKRALNPKEAARIKNIIDDLPSQYESAEDNTMLQNAKGFFKQGIDNVTGLALKPLTWSETVKNIVYYAAGEINAERKGITNPAEVQRDAIRFVGEHAIAGGKGTTPGISESSLGSAFFLFRNFTIRNFDDFVDFVEKASRGETGDNYWDAKYEKKYGSSNKTKDGRNRASFKLAAKAVGGRVLRSYFFWLLVGSYFGKNFIDALGGDPTGVTDGGRNRGLYDDEDTEENEGMTDLDNFINNIPAGVIFGTLQDLYFAARRRGVDSNQFLSFDVWNDATFNRSLENHLPLGVAYNRFADMLELLDRGYSFSSTGRKTYAAPESASDVIKGFLFGKATTENSLAYGKYRYGNVNLWGDISSGDWMDFAMNANPFTGGATFDTTRKNYTGVFDGSYNDIATMQLIIAEFKKRQQSIIDDFNRDKYRYGGEWDGLTDDEKVAKAKDIREKKINDYTADVQRAVDAFTDAGNALSDKQITNLMYLFDFHEGEEDDEWNSSVARERYVEAGLPDYNAAGIQRGTTTENGQKQEVTKGMLDRSLVLQNAQQGFYGASREAANAIKDALKDFKSTYKEYNTRVKALNEKYFAAREKNKKSSETKQLSKDLEKLQNEYLDKLFAKLEPVIDKYGTASIGTYDGADVLSEYMGNMIPYSSIKKYGQTYSSGNDIVYGQLTEWLQKRLGRNAPTAPSDKEVTNGISEIKKLIDQGKTAAAKSKARAILEKIGRGSLGARRYDVETLRDVAYD